jgi:hypothetical protein
MIEIQIHIPKNDDFSNWQDVTIEEVIDHFIAVYIIEDIYYWFSSKHTKELFLSYIAPAKFPNYWATTTSEMIAIRLDHSLRINRCGPEKEKA